MSSIFVKGGWYWYQRYTYNPKTGKRNKRIYRRLKTQDRKEALLRQRRLDKNFDETDSKHDLKPPNPLSLCIEKYLASKQERVERRKLSQTTVNQSEFFLNQFADFMHPNYGDLDVRHISTNHIEEFERFRWSQPKVKSSTTVAINLRNLRAFINYCVKNGWITESPFSGFKIEPGEERTAYPRPEEFEKLKDFFAAAAFAPAIDDGKTKYGINKRKGKKQWLYDNTWFSKLIYLILNTGMRVGETTILKWNPDSEDTGKKHSYSYAHLSKDMKTIIINFKRRYREIPVTNLLPLFKSIPREYEVVKNGKRHMVKKKYVFENPITGAPPKTSTVANVWRKFTNDFKHDNNWTPHSLRHGVATYLVNRGKNPFQIQALLGHSNLEMTRMYGHVGSDDLVDIVDFLGETGEKKHTKKK